MDKITTENLFLLEFLVDTVNLDPKCECDAPAGETCVSFQFLDNAPLDVCEADFIPNRNIRNDTESVKSGKSCLFSLSPEQANNALEQFDIYVSIMKKMQPGWLPEKVEIGVSVISISDLFNELISSVEMSDGSTPIAKTLKDVFEIFDLNGKAIGKVGVYIRMSCFGKLIVTQFQMNLNDKTVLFKDKEGKSLYRYKKAGKKSKKDDVAEQRGYNSNCPITQCQSDMTKMQTNADAIVTNYTCPSTSCQNHDTNMNPNIPLTTPLPNQIPCIECGGLQLPPCLPTQQTSGFLPSATMTPCVECGTLPNPPCLDTLGYKSTAGGVPCKECGYQQNSPYMQRLGPSYAPEGNYQEIGASMGGNSLTIRVHKDKSTIEPVNGGALARTTAPQAYDIRPGVSRDSPFSIKVGQRGEGASGDNGVVVNPPVCTTSDGMQFTEFSDPNKEMFVLRIGKKSEGVDRKHNLELELQTPKAPPLKPIPKKETVETQYDLQDVGARDAGSVASAPAAKKAAAGKKGKGGKKK